jgi:glutaminase
MACGMYEASAAWEAEVGLAAKSGVSGAIFAAAPGLCGIASYSPRIDAEGNSVRGTAFFRHLVRSGLLPSSSAKS